LRLVWSERSLEDRREIYAYIEIESPRSAAALDDRIGEAARQLIHFPESGRSGRVDATRELVVTRTPFVLPYRIEADVVRILRVIHGAREWP
jgi:toxin ParE1/3/4